MSTSTDTAGFYFFDGNPALVHATEWVTGPGFTLDADTPTDLGRTVHGWAWFDTAEDAYAAHGLTYPVPERAPEPAT